MKTIFIAVLCTLLCSTTYGQQSWQYVGAPGFSSGVVNESDICFDSNGTPFVAFAESPSGGISVMKYNGSNWVYVGSPQFSGGASNWITIDIDANDTLYVGFINPVDSSKGCVMKFNGTTWNYVGNSGFTVGLVAYSVLRLDANGIPHFAFSEGLSGSRCSVMKFTNGSWSYVGSPRFSTGYINWIDLEFQGGYACVAYQDVPGGQRGIVKKFNGTNWITVGPGFYSSGTSSTNYLAVSSSDTLYVSYSDGAAGTAGTVKKFDGTNWVNVGNAGYTPAGAEYNDIAFSGDTIITCFYDLSNGEANVMKFDGTSWSFVGSASFTPASIGPLAMALDPGGIPYVTFQDFDAAGYNSVMKYGACVNSAFTINPQVCFSYSSPAGNTYTASGTYYDTLMNAIGCDSILTINLTIDTVNTVVALTGDTLTSMATSATFQWLDCSNMQPINGSTGQSFTPGQNGNYAVEITQNGCVDTSSCYAILTTGIDYIVQPSVFIQPILGGSSVLIKFNGAQPETFVVSLVDIAGKIISTQVVELADNTSEYIYHLDSYPNGAYYFVIDYPNNSTATKVVIIR